MTIIVILVLLGLTAWGFEQLFNQQDDTEEEDDNV